MSTKKTKKKKVIDGFTKNPKNTTSKKPAEGPKKVNQEKPAEAPVEEPIEVSSEDTTVTIIEADNIEEPEETPKEGTDNDIVEEPAIEDDAPTETPETDIETDTKTEPEKTEEVEAVKIEVESAPEEETSENKTDTEPDTAISSEELVASAIVDDANLDQNLDELINDIEKDEKKEENKTDKKEKDSKKKGSKPLKNKEDSEKKVKKEQKEKRAKKAPKKAKPFRWFSRFVEEQDAVRTLDQEMTDTDPGRIRSGDLNRNPHILSFTRIFRGQRSDLRDVPRHISAVPAHETSIFFETLHEFRLPETFRHHILSDRRDDGTVGHARDVESFFIYGPFPQKLLHFEVVEIQLVFKERFHGVILDRNPIRQDCGMDDRGSGIEPGNASAGVGVRFESVVPPRRVRSHIRRAFLVTGTAHTVVERMRHEKILSAYQDPVREPLDLLKRQIMSVGSVKFVEVPRASKVRHGTGGSLRIGRMRTVECRVSRLDVPPDDVLAGDLEDGLRRHVVGVGRMTAERDTVFCAPLGKGTVVGVDQNGVQCPIVRHSAGRGFRSVAEPEVCQIRREIVPEPLTDFFQCVCVSGDHTACGTASEFRRFIREDA